MLQSKASLLGSTAPVKEISGRAIARRLRRGDIDPEHQARLAEGLRTGKLRLIELTSAQARWITGATVAAVAAERRRARTPSDSAVARYVRRAGAERVMRALDHLTQPSLVAAE